MEEEEEEEEGLSTFLAPSAFFLRSLMSLRAGRGEVELEMHGERQTRKISKTT